MAWWNTNCVVFDRVVLTITNSTVVLDGSTSFACSPRSGSGTYWYAHTSNGVCCDANGFVTIMYVFENIFSFRFMLYLLFSNWSQLTSNSSSADYVPGLTKRISAGGSLSANIGNLNTLRVL